MNRLTGASIAALVAIVAAVPIVAYAVGDDDSGRPPGAAAHPGHPTGKDRAAGASGPGRAHAEAMKAWAKCVAMHAREDRPAGVRPKDLCPPKPVPPGRAKHGLGPAGPPPWAHGKHGKHGERPSHPGEDDD